MESIWFLFFLYMWFTFPLDFRLLFLFFFHFIILWGESCLVGLDSLQPHGLYSPWTSPDQNTGVGSLSFNQVIFRTQKSNPGLLRYRRIFFYQLSHQGNPRILEWVACPFSTRSSWPRNQTRVPCIAGEFFTSWATKETYVRYIMCLCVGEHWGIGFFLVFPFSSDIYPGVELVNPIVVLF